MASFLSRLVKGLAAAAILLSLSLGTAEAQTTIDVGPRIGYELDDVESLFIGVDSRFGIDALPILIAPYFDYYFPDGDVTLFQLGVNAIYEFGIDNQAFTPYAGAGLAISRISWDYSDFGVNVSDSSTEPGLNLFAGATFGFGQMRPFAQVGLSLGDWDFFTIGGGLLFRVSP